MQIVFACLLAVAAAAPDFHSETPPPLPAYRAPPIPSDQIPILQDDRVYPSATDFETSDGMMIPSSGYGSSPDDAMEFQVYYSFTFPDGQDFELPS